MKPTAITAASGTPATHSKIDIGGNRRTAAEDDYIHPTASHSPIASTSSEANNFAGKFTSQGPPLKSASSTSHNVSASNDNTQHSYSASNSNSSSSSSNYGATSTSSSTSTHSVGSSSATSSTRSSASTSIKSGIMEMDEDEDVGNADDMARDDDENPDELLCGYGKCAPKWLQVFHNAKWLLTMLGICAFVQSFVVNSIFPVGLSTLEKRFHMTSTQTGIISSWYDFAVLIAVFPVCHWGNTGHKGRWIGYGTFVMGLGSFVCALPHYIIEPYKVGENVNETDYGQCMSTRHLIEEKCVPRNDDDASYFNPYFLIFLLGQTFHGVGATPLFSIGTTYLDENVSQKASPVYLAIHAVVTSIGPVIGLFVGGFLLNIYDDFDRVDMSKIALSGPSDPRWVGAWWLGFLGCAVAAILTAFPILGFARELPEAKKHRVKDVNQVHAVSQVDEGDQILKGKMKDLPHAIWNILRNPTFITCIALGISESIVINGFAAFMPKILETILSTTPTNASYLSSVVIFAAAAGVLIGGMVIRQMNLQVGGMLKMIFVCHVIALVLIISFLIQCPAREFVGITTGYHQQKLGGLNGNSGSVPEAISNYLWNECNEKCICPEKWNPVCDTQTQETYYSACHAGCFQKTITADFTTVWRNCQCVTPHNNTLSSTTMLSEEPLRTSTFSTLLSTLTTTAIGGGLLSTANNSEWIDRRVVGGFCTKECGVSMWIFLALLFFSVVASFASGIPSQQIMLRVIPFQQRTLGIGVHWTFLRLLGFIPGGVLFGLMIDTTCLKWQHSACGKNQSCLVHDPYKLSWTIMAVAVVCKLVSILATIVGYLTYRPNDLDNALSIQTVDSRGPLSLTVNDDRPSKMKNGGPQNSQSNQNGYQNHHFYTPSDDKAITDYMMKMAKKGENGDLPTAPPTYIGKTQRKTNARSEH